MSEFTEPFSQLSTPLNGGSHPSMRQLKDPCRNNNSFKKLSGPCLKSLNDKGYAPHNNRSCFTTTPATILSLKPWLVSSHIFGPRL